MRRRTWMAAGTVAPWLALGMAPSKAQSLEARPVIEWPAITLLDGRTLTPASWQGQSSVVVFWATYCPFCKRHNAHIDKLHRAAAGQALRVLGVALESDSKAVREYMASHHFDFPVTLDGGRLRQRLTARHVIPMTCLLDRQSRLLQAIPGEMSEEDVLGLARVLGRPAG